MGKKYTIIIVTLFVIGGCAPGYKSAEYLDQEYWMNNLNRTYGLVQDFRVNNTDLLKSDQLTVMVDEPDYKMTIPEFQNLSPNYVTPGWVSKVLSEFDEDMEKWTSGPYRSHPPLAKLPRSDIQVWIYAEAKHFSKPFSKHCCDVGFENYVFFVDKNTNVLASGAFHSEGSLAHHHAMTPTKAVISYASPRTPADKGSQGFDTESQSPLPAF
jgi:hypothetical protein